MSLKSREILSQGIIRAGFIRFCSTFNLHILVTGSLFGGSVLIGAFPKNEPTLLLARYLPRTVASSINATTQAQRPQRAKLFRIEAGG
jgi:hypothetical protein